MQNPRKWRLRDANPPRLWRMGYVLTLSAAIAIAALVSLSWLALALLSYPRLPHSRALSLHDTVGVLQLVFASIAGAGALVALIVAYRRQRVAETDSANDRIRVFNERFVAIAAQLGDDNAAVRLAGVHAMAGLADDWPENRQTCVDVLCAYLRMPYKPDPGESAPTADKLAFGADREVRHSVIRVITAHLRAGAAVSWHGLGFDFTGVVFDGGDFNRATFSGGTVHFTGAKFSGEVDFAVATFSGAEVDFNDATFSGGRVNFVAATFSGGKVSFTGATFSGGTVYFGGATFSGAEVSFSSGYSPARFSGGTVEFAGAKFSGGTVSFGSAEFSGGTVSFPFPEFSGGTVSFSGVKFSGAEVTFSLAQFSGAEVMFWSALFSAGVSFLGSRFSGGTVSFSHAKFSGGTVSFSEAKFSGAEFNFTYAEFSGGEVDFSNVEDWSCPPEFPWTGVPPAGVKLPGRQAIA
jgi:uncharacterized protein YjbI with pentapeptide repeats